MKESKTNRYFSLLSVGLGSGFGGIVRYFSETIFSPLFDHPFPFEILLVNLLGSFGIGTFAAMRQLSLISRYFLIAGFFGGFTTFSMFSLQTMELLKTGNPTAAFGNIFATVCGGIVAVWLGTRVGSIRREIEP